MYGTLLPLAAVKFSSRSNNSDMSLTVISGKFLQSSSSDIIDDWGPVHVLKYLDHLAINLSLDSTYFSNQSHHSGMQFWCQMTNKGAIAGVRILLHCPVRQVFNSSAKQFVFLPVFPLSILTTKITALHFEHCRDFFLSDWTLPQPLHRRDLLLLLSIISCPAGTVVSRFLGEYPGSCFYGIHEPCVLHNRKQNNGHTHHLPHTAGNPDNANFDGDDLADNCFQGHCRVSNHSLDLWGHWFLT